MNVFIIASEWGHSEFTRVAQPIRKHHTRPFTGHSVSTVEEAGFKGLKNGQLLSAATGNFDVLVTVDKNIPHQQNLHAFNISILILVATSNRYQDLKTLAPKALDSLKRIKPGETVRVG